MLLFGILATVIGLVVIAATLKNWDWYMTRTRTRLLVMLIGRPAVRIVHFLFGALSIVIGIAAIISVFAGN